MAKFRLTKSQLIGATIALIILILALIFLREQRNLFYFVLGIGFVIGGFPFFISIILESNATREKDEMFLEFSRNLVENVKAGTPISRSILNIRTKDYGALNPYVNKLANQISIGIPIQSAMETFARDIGSPTVSRAIGIIGESEKAGGKIEDILEAVATSVSQIEKLRKERKAAMYSLVVQGYIIFLIFIVIMLVMQFQILPIAGGLSQGISPDDVKGDSSSSIGGGMLGMFGGQKATPEELTQPFIWLLLVQGFFAGLVIGKISEGKVKYGFKHSFILLVLALLIDTGTKLFLGGTG